MANVHLLKGVQGKIGADFLVCIGFTTKVLKEGFKKIEDLSRKDVMDG